MAKQHKYAELIKAWADGAEIEVLGADGEWHFVDKPQWDARKYRIKGEEAEPIQRFLWAYRLDSDGKFVISSVFLSENEAEEYFGDNDFFPLDWSLTEFEE